VWVYFRVGVKRFVGFMTISISVMGADLSAVGDNGAMGDG